MSQDYVVFTRNGKIPCSWKLLSFSSLDCSLQVESFVIKSHRKNCIFITSTSSIITVENGTLQSKYVHFFTYLFMPDNTNLVCSFYSKSKFIIFHRETWTKCLVFSHFHAKNHVVYWNFDLKSWFAYFFTHEERQQIKFSL